MTDFKVDSEQRFVCCFTALGACITDLYFNLKPVIKVDGTHLKDKNMSILFVVVAKDDNEHLFRGKTSVEDNDIQGLKYLKLVIKETFRLHPPIPLLPQQMREECTVDGYSIPTKTKVMLNIWSMGRDPKYWEEPQLFRPERFENSPKDFVGNNFEFIPFGAGRRICPGMNFGLANIELPLAKLLYHFDWKLAKGVRSCDLDMSEGEGLTVSRKLPLLLVPTLCNPLN